MQVLVTGGAGYIGSVVTDFLIEAGHQVVVLDSLISGHASAVHPEAELVVADARDDEALGRLFSTHRFDAVVHACGYIQAGESARHPGRYFANNIGSAISVLNALVHHDVGIFVFSSSAAVYGVPQSLPLQEDHPLQPANPYGETKATVERLLAWYEQCHGLRYISLRYFNAAGATPRLGEDHRPESHLIPILLEVALGQREAAPLYGQDYPTPDGTCVRDYVHVADLARAHVLALERLAQGHPSGPYNLGLGRGFSNLEVLEAARRVTGHPIPVEWQPRRPGDPPVLVASPERARSGLGWQPRHTSLEEIIASAWEWRRSRPEGYPD
jgi:UDP-glucose 4-epimerase